MKFFSENNARNRLFRKLAALAGEKFARYYASYRRQAERRIYARGSNYRVPEGDMKHSIACSIELLLRGVTPKELLSYWHVHIRDFSAGGLVIPPLAFLKSGANVDRVLIAKTSKLSPRKKDRDVSAPHIRGNTYSDSGRIDRRLRPALTEAGFDLGDVNDRFLLSVQHTAMSLAKGRAIYVPDTPMGKMSRWAARNVYGVTK